MIDGGWNIAGCVSRSYDLEGMEVGTVGAGRIGSAVLRRLKPFEVGLHYTDRHRLPEELERELGLTYRPLLNERLAPQESRAPLSLLPRRVARASAVFALWGPGLMAAGPVPQAYSSRGEKRRISLVREEPQLAGGGARTCWLTSNLGG